MGKLKDIDSKAEAKGAGVVTFWQFVKFIFVSLLAMIVQVALLNAIQNQCLICLILLLISFFKTLSSISGVSCWILSFMDKTDMILCNSKSK